jgi:dipeptidyl aminopeptidase/acylaminoacyl peptidase
MKKHILTFIILLYSQFSFADVIPLEVFLKQADISSIKISPDGKHLAAIVESDGDKKLSVIDIKNNQIIHTANFPHKKQEIGDYGWFNNNRIYATMVYKVGKLAEPRDSGYMYAVNIDGKKAMQLMPSKAKKNDKFYRGYSLLSYLPGDGDHILISEPDDLYSVAYKLNVNSGRKKRVAKSPEKFSSLLPDNKGNVRVAQSRDELGEKVKVHLMNSQNEWLLFREFDAKSIYLSILGFSKDNKILIIELSNEEYKRGIYKLDIASKEINLIIELNDDVDIENLIYDLDFDNPEVIGIVQMKGYLSYEFFDNKHEVAKIYRSLHNAFKGEAVSIVNFSQGKSKGIVRVWSDKNPSSYYMFDLKSYKLEFMFDTYPWVDRQKMASMKPVSFTARDGLEIRGYLTLPNDKPKNLPMILMVHGGPYGPKDEWRYNRETQLFASRGYAVFQVNFRGSGGRGADFIYDAYKQMGREMQDDLTDATLWAVEQGYANTEKLCI